VPFYTVSSLLENESIPIKHFAYLSIQNSKSLKNSIWFRSQYYQIL